MFYDRKNNQRRFLFSIPGLNSVPFVLCLLCYYLFMKISRSYWAIIIFYVFIILSLMLSLPLALSLLQPGKPAK